MPSIAALSHSRLTMSNSRHEWRIAVGWVELFARPNVGKPGAQLLGLAKSSSRVEERRGDLGHAAIVPFPLLAHRTGRADFPHPALRPASQQDPRPEVFVLP